MKRIHAIIVLCCLNLVSLAQNLVLFDSKAGVSVPVFNIVKSDENSFECEVSIPALYAEEVLCENGDIYNIAICWFVHIVKGRRTVIACFDEIDRDTFC